jgi:hypothetical protein
VEILKTSASELADLFTSALFIRSDFQQAIDAIHFPE